MFAARGFVLVLMDLHEFRQYFFSMTLRLRCASLVKKYTQIFNK